MNQASSSEPRTAPYLAGVVIAAVVVIALLHFSGFHFVAAGSVGR